MESRTIYAFCGDSWWPNRRKPPSIGIAFTARTSEGENYARFQYAHASRSTGEKTECECRVHLVTTPCHRLSGPACGVDISLDCPGPVAVESYLA